MISWRSFEVTMDFSPATNPFSIFSYSAGWGFAPLPLQFDLLICRDLGLGGGASAFFASVFTGGA